MYSAFGWGLDFWRAFLERPKVVRWLVKTLMGKYAWSEIVGLKMGLEKDGYSSPIYPYDLEHMEYHKENWAYKDW